MNRNDRDSNERAEARIRTGAADIAEALGEGWSVVDPDMASGSLQLHGPDRIALSLIADPRDPQIPWTVFGLLTPDERTTAPQAYPTPITFPRHNTARRIARGIRERYLGAWTAHLSQTRAAMTIRDASRDRVFATGEQLIAALGDRAAWTPPRDPAGSQITVGSDGDPVHGRLVITDPISEDTTATRVTVDLQMSPQDALAVVALLAGRRPDPDRPR